MWYNNERDRKSIYYADSPDLTTWTDRGKCTGVGERPGEGPVCLSLARRLLDARRPWKGLGVYRSLDLKTWTAATQRSPRHPGQRPRRRRQRRPPRRRRERRPRVLFLFHAPRPQRHDHPARQRLARSPPQLDPSRRALRAKRPPHLRPRHAHAHRARAAGGGRAPRPNRIRRRSRNCGRSAPAAFARTTLRRW
jgi:hypothetical protein